MTPGRFLLMNIVMIVGSCSLYLAYLVLLVRKRLRNGVYESPNPGGR